MKTTELTYPVFSANQVLTEAQLNDMFQYLDEQTRLTRANLIGIGIVCGLEVRFDKPNTIHLSKGVGVTSQGYLIVEPRDIDLIAARPYTLPADYGYPPFIDPTKNPQKQYDLWELFPDDDERGAAPLSDIGPALVDKAVVLFLELLKGGLGDCRPNNCDDRGNQVRATVRRLLIDIADLDQVIASAGKMAPIHLGADLTERLALPDLRMPRFDVPNSGPVASEEVLRAFQETFRQNKLAAGTAAALTALYKAFKPLVVEEFPSNPFATFINRFGFLDISPVTAAQVRFLQYYWDLFDDLLAAYDELRWKGVDLMCACCPPEELFPRHLMAGVLDPVNHDAADYRNHFLPSPAVGDCADRTREVRILFRRLVAMLASFTETPPDKGIRATPSRWGTAPVSAKAIPWYYDEDGTPPLFELWDPVKTVRGRANQNLSCRAEEYAPAPPTFVTDPLRFDLEPNNFLRIEGHLGKNVQNVLDVLLSLRESHRLPFEVIALRTGAFDENIDIDLGKEGCRFSDLETLYETLRTELICFLVKQVQYFYSVPLPELSSEQPFVPTLWLLKTYAPDFVAQPKTLGWVFEALLTWRPGTPLPLIFWLGGPHLVTQAFALVGAMSALAERLPEDLRQIDFAAFAELYHRLVEIARKTEEYRRAGAFDEPGLSDRLDDIVYRCRLDPFEALAEEYKRRARDAKQAQFLGHFLRNHPGIQHKAGVPLGGTFILIYHELPKVPPRRPVIRPIPGPRLQLDEDKIEQLDDALARLPYKAQLAEDPDLQLIYKIVTGNLLVSKLARSKVARRVYFDAVARLADGTVIADFFLPYACCSNCPPIQYQLPPARLRVNLQAACTNLDGSAEVTLTTEGAAGAVSVSVDGGAFQASTGGLLLTAGQHSVVVRDAAGNESPPVAISIPAPLQLGTPQVVVDQAAGTWHVVFTVTGGTPPYAADVGTVVEATYTSPALPVADVLQVVIKDTAGCTAEGRFESGVVPCKLPCEGEAIRAGYRFWIPEAPPGLPINDYKAVVSRFAIREPDGNLIELSPAEVTGLIQHPSPIRTADYGGVVQRWLDAINKLVANKVGSDRWFTLEYEPAPAAAMTGTLFVDRLTCLDFTFELVVTFSQEKKRRRLKLTYNAGGTVVQESDTEPVVIPPFRGSTSNKCRPTERPVLLCERTDLTLQIERDGVITETGTGTVTLTAVLSGQDQEATLLWEIQDGIPSIAGGKQVVLKFDPIKPAEKLVLLTAITDTGCTVTLDQTINIAKLEG